MDRILLQLPTAWQTLDMASDELDPKTPSPHQGSETCTSVSDPFNCEGKRHVLPLSLLLKLENLVQAKPDFVSRQILSDDMKSAPVSSLSNAEPDQGTDEDSLSAFKFPDFFENSGSSEKEKPAKSSKTKKYKLQSQDVRKMKGYPKKRKKSKSTSEDEETERPKRKLPNYFVAVQVTNPEILDIAKKIQTGIQEKSEVNLEKAFVGLEKSHVTLMVMHLPNEEEVKKAAKSLEQCVAAISKRTDDQPIILDFEGLSTFSGGRVLFASLKPTEGLEHLHFIAEEVSKQMGITGIVSTDKANKEFNPHLTLMKFVGDKELRKQGINKVEASLYLPYASEVFGRQTVSSLQLCRMNKKREDGYYFVEHEVFFGK